MNNLIIKIILRFYKFFEKEQKSFSLHNLENLINFVNSSKLVLFDIGSRMTNSSKSIPSRLDLLKKNSELIICDADLSSNDKTFEKLQSNGWKNINIFPHALSNINKKFLDLYLTKAAGLSSTLKPNESYVKKLPNFLRNDFMIIKKIEVSNKRLIDVLNEFSLEGISHIDIDTQGTELDILKSGEKIIKESLISLSTEISFREIYSNQCLFKDIDDYLLKFGFEIFELDRSLLLNDSDIKYSKKVLFQGDALYFKKPDYIVKNHKDPGLDLMKLISMLFTFYHFDESLRILNNNQYRQLISNVYSDSKLINLEKEIKIFSDSFNYHNKIFLKGYKFRKYIYKDRDNLQH